MGKQCPTSSLSASVGWSPTGAATVIALDTVRSCNTCSSGLNVVQDGLPLSDSSLLKNTYASCQAKCVQGVLEVQA